MWTAKEAVKVVKGRLSGVGADRSARGVSTDSRTLKKGEAFVALKGPNFDGTRFAADALRKGAPWVMVERGAKLGTLLESGCVIEVADTLDALGELTRDWRGRFAAKVVGITGSVGKSTTKEMTAAVLGARGKVLKNPGNFNNRIGLPRTVFQLGASHQFAVLEMGCNEPGEIKALTYAARPDVGIITRVAAVHLEGLGSIDGVARAKGELIRGLDPRATFILNLDDPRIVKQAKNFKGRIIGVSLKAGAGCSGEALRLVEIEKDVAAGRPYIVFTVEHVIAGKRKGRPVEFRLPTLSGHNAGNAMLAAAAGLALGVKLPEAAARLRSFKGLSGRGEVIRHDGLFIMNDTYNASPPSVTMALETMAWWKGPMRGVAVLGEMLELGKDAEKLHREVGVKAARVGVDFLIAKGKLGKALVAGAREAGMPRDRAHAVMENQEAVKLLVRELKKGDWVLVKGSRRTAMEEVVKGIVR